MTNEFNGFCLCNNVAIAAKHAVDNLGVKRVLIVDFDAHHGQGTQRLFYDNPQVNLEFQASLQKSSVEYHIEIA